MSRQQASLLGGEKMLAEGLVDGIASDAHHVGRRAQVLSKAGDLVAVLADDDTAYRLVAKTPLHILQNVIPSALRQR